MVACAATRYQVSIPFPLYSPEVLFSIVAFNSVDYFCKHCAIMFNLNNSENH